MRRSIASHDDAFVEYDSSTDVWSIGNRGTQLSVGFDRAGTFAVQSLTNLSTGSSWDLTPAADVGVLGTATGESLMQDGIELDHQQGSSLAHVLVLTVDPGSASTVRSRR